MSKQFRVYSAKCCCGCFVDGEIKSKGMYDVGMYVQLGECHLPDLTRRTVYNLREASHCQIQ